MQFIVPQFIDVETKIIGPISVRQFIILLICGGIIFLLYKITSFWIFITGSAGVLIFGSLFAFVKINSQPFHLFMLNFIQTLKRPALRVWWREFVIFREKQKKTKEVPAVFIPKHEVSSSRLSEISLIVDTGGQYQEQTIKQNNK